MLFPLMMGAGILLQGLSAYRQGQYQASQYEAQRQQELYNARIAEADAAAAQRRTEFEQTRAAMEAEQIMGRMRVGMGASGARTDVGTNFLIRLQQSAESELDNYLIGLEGRTMVGKYKSEAAQRRAQAGMYGTMAKSAKRAGTLGAAATILGGFGTMGAMGMFNRPPKIESAGGAYHWGAGQRRAASLAGP